jgi:hypothetical protein
MDLFATPWDLISPFVVWALGLPVASWLGRYFGQTQKRSWFLYVWHTIWCVAYLVFTLSNGGDSLDYYSTGSQGFVEFSFGTAAVGALTYFLASPLQLSYLSCFLVYNIVGLVGFIGLDAILRQLTYLQSALLKRLAALIILLPSVSFWSSSIGKDGFAFSASVLALWAALDLRRRIPLMVVAVLLMLLVRPHVAGFLVLALASDAMSNPQLPLIRRTGLLLVVLVAAIWVLPLVIQYVGIAEIDSAQSATAYIEQRQSYNQAGAGGIDISAMPLPLQLFSYLLRPTFFDVNSLLSLLAAIDNFVLLVIFSLAVYGLAQGRRIQSHVSIVFQLTYSSLAWIVFSVTTANLGISIRQKWMFLPMLLYVAFSLAGRSRRLTISSASS